MRPLLFKRVWMGLSLLAVLANSKLLAQNNPTITIPGVVQTFPQIAEGIPVRNVIIVLHKNNQQIIADSLATAKFYEAFGIKPGASFKQFSADLAIRTIEALPDIKSADYQLFNNEISGPLIMVLNVFFLAPGELKEVNGKKGMIATKSISSFPVISETDKSKLMLILNGGIGFFNEENAFFSRGADFTQGNPVADDPAGRGTRFWGEIYLEPGMAGIARFGKSKTYGYAALTGLVSARNNTDIYSAGNALFFDVERAYVGIMGASLGKKKQTSFDFSVGRQFFQLNDGFLLSKFSGSANAGPRGSVYLNSRTAFQKSILGKVHVGKWMMQGFFLEPEELFKDRQNNLNYGGGGLTYNNNKSIDVGLYYIQITGGKGTYALPQGSFDKKGMYIINPKLWLTNIVNSGLFFKSEYAFQRHHQADMKAGAWYVGLGLSKNNWRKKPSLYYRYANMSGDNPNTSTYERFDPLLTGGLGNWVQGLNFRKIIGNGNIQSHRIELKTYFSKSFECALDYFHLRAANIYNKGGLAPIALLNNRSFGQEVTLTTRYFINDHFLLLGIFSHAWPGDGLKNSFTDRIYPWTSVQTSLFMFF